MPDASQSDVTALARIRRSQTERAVDDVRASLANWRLWTSLAWADIVQRYRGSLLGPFWLTLSTAALIGGLGPIYSTLFGTNLRDYLPYLALGLLAWNFISASISESCKTFIEAGPVMKQIRMPLLNHVLHLMTRNVIIFLHGIPLYGLVVIGLQLPIGWQMLWAVPGFLALAAMLVAIGLVVAIISVRFRDFIQVVGSVLQIAFFITPIIWHPGDRPGLNIFSDLNPLSAMVNLIRNPLLLAPTSSLQSAVVVLTFVVSVVVATLLFVRYRQRIVYWV